jgi:ATP-dependent exoDNAse (exonuclease V) alpha subunit
MPWRNSYSMLRTQFPLRLAYAMTYNKCQGQTLGRVLLDSTTEPFAHGHLYVALSRVFHKDNIRLFVLDTALHESDVQPGIFFPTVVSCIQRPILDCTKPT